MNELPESSEPVKTQEVFEHMFPGNSWDSFKKLDVRNIDFFARQLIPNPTVDQGAEIGDAIKAGKGYADRLDLPHPDKATVSWALLEVSPVNDSPVTVRGWISDLLNEGERLGGIGIKPVSWLKFNRLANTVAAMSVGQEFYETATAMVAGVLSPEGLPVAVITFRKGDRPRRGIKEKTPGFILSSKPLQP